MKIAAISPLALAAILGFAISANAQTILKCQDETGKWHYGDRAAEACENAKITEIDNRGLTVQEIEVPPTTEEIQAARNAEEQAAEEQARLDAQLRADRQLLSVYENEDQIIEARDTRLVAIDNYVEINREFMTKLEFRENLIKEELKSRKLKKIDKTRLTNELDDVRAQIGAYMESTRSRMEQREEVVQRFENELRRYRAAKDRVSSIQ